MIENELKRMFPGVQFHHVSPDKLKGRDESVQLTADLHNAAEVNYSLIKQFINKIKTATQATETYQVLMGLPTRGINAEDLESMEQLETKAFNVVLDTNRALRKDLQEKHSR